MLQELGKLYFLNVFYIFVTKKNILYHNSSEVRQQILCPFLSRFIIFLPKFILGNCKDNLNTWKDKADERRREMAALEVKISEENSKEKKVEGNIIFVFRTN
mgnify:CR=1 FL=1